MHRNVVAKGTTLHTSKPTRAVYTPNPSSILSQHDPPLLVPSDSLSHVLQQSLAVNLVAAILPKIHRLDPALRHRAHQPPHVRPLGRAINLQRALASELARNLIDDAPALVGGQRVLELDHRVRVGEELRRGAVARVEDDVRGCLGDARPRVRGRGFVVGVYSAAVLAADVVKVDAAEADVGVSVTGPARVGVDVGVDGRDVPLAVGRVHVPDRVDVGVAVELRDAGDDVRVRRVAGGARSAVRVDDDLPLHVGVGFDGRGDVVPGGAVVAGVEVEGEDDGERV